MPSTHSSLLLHFVFSTKDRFPFITGEWRGALHEYLGGCLRTLGAVSLRVGGTSDHIHMLVGAKPIHTPADLVREVKKASTTWIHQTHAPKFAWQEGYGAFSYSRSHLPQVVRYIQDQEQHHHKQTFLDEYKSLLQAFQIEYDERYIRLGVRLSF